MVRHYGRPPYQQIDIRENNALMSSTAARDINWHWWKKGF
jgi:hypothetical protein